MVSFSILEPTLVKRVLIQILELAQKTSQEERNRFYNFINVTSI